MPRFLVGFVSLVIVLCLAALSPAQPDPEEQVPITGKAGPGLERFDRAVRDVMDRHGIPGAALAIAREGTLGFAKGYGWADVKARMPARPDTLFGMASISKPITALAILRLVEEGKVRLDEPAFLILGNIAPPRGVRIDPRLVRI